MFEALWTPSWYALDQPLKVGEAGDFSFFVKAPDYVTADHIPILYHGIAHEGEFSVCHCKVERIVHAQLGDLTEVAIRVFDYAFILPSGDEIEVNAEEEPGVAYDCPLEIADWSLKVLLEPVSPPIPFDRAPRSPQLRHGPPMTHGEFMSQLATLVAANRNDEAFDFLKANFADVEHTLKAEDRMLIADWMEGVAMALDAEASRKEPT